MASNKKSVEFTAKNVKAFTAWLKRFSTIDNSLLLEIDQKKSMFIAKTYSEDRSVVKLSSIKFDEAGLTTASSKETKRIKVGIFNIPRLIKTIDQFNDEEFSIVVEFQEVISDSDTQFAGEKILFKSKSLKMNLDCTSLNIFKYLSDELFETRIAAVETIIGTFDLTKSIIEKINVLNNLDNENKFMEFIFENGNISVAGKSYDLLIETGKVTDSKLSIFKDQYSMLDVENYSVTLGEDRLVFNSKDSETTTVISKAEDSDS